ncbi:MAG: DUF447 domain-containing protein [Promethearchaeota archaeon]
MKFNPGQFGLIETYLYEVLATTFSIHEETNRIIPNTSCMGIRLHEGNLIQMRPYPSSQTFKNIGANNLVGINFVDDIYLYALATLKVPHSKFSITQFPEIYYDYLDVNDVIKKTELLKNELIEKGAKFPILKDAWGVLICEKVQESEEFRENHVGILKLKSFLFEIRYFKKQKESYKLFNRAENLILENLILATRLKVARQNKNERLFNELYKKIITSMKYIKRFCKNQEALKSLDLIEEYVDYWTL